MGLVLSQELGKLVVLIGRENVSNFKWLELKIQWAIRGSYLVDIHNWAPELYTILAVTLAKTPVTGIALCFNSSNPFNPQNYSLRYPVG